MGAAPAAAHRDSGSRFQVSAEARAVGLSTAVTWAGDALRGDDRVHALFSREPQVKVVYAVTKGRRSRLRTVAPLIQADVDAVDAAVLGATGGARTVRFDRGTRGGARYVDIQVVRLRRPAAAYLRDGQPEVARGSALNRELRAATRLRPGRDLLVYVDGLGGASVSGEADAVVEDPTPGAANRSNRGGRIAAVYGPESLPGASAAGLAPELALHELLHAFGAVQPDSPHATVGAHCFDGQDVMCYDDGSLRSGLYTPQACQKLHGLVIDSPIDCGHDDYFAVAPSPGSYLASHWNSYDSVFLGACSDPRMGAACAPPAAAGGSAAVPAVAAALLSSAPVQRTDTGGRIATVTVALRVGETTAVADVSGTPVTLPLGSYRLVTCVKLTSGGQAPWQQCWSRDTTGGPQRPLDESLTVTRPPTGTAVVSGTVSIVSGARTVAATASPAAVEVPQA